MPACGARSSERLPVRKLRQLLRQPFQVRRRFHPLGLELPPIVGAELRDPPFRLVDQRTARRDGEVLAAQVLLLLDALALLVGIEDAASEAVLRQLLERLFLLDVVRQDLLELCFGDLRRGEVVARLFEQRSLLRERALVRADVGRVLGLHL